MKAWEVHQSPSGKTAAIYEHPFRRIATVDRDTFRNEPASSMRARARVMAASRELLDACKRAARLCEYCHGTRNPKVILRDEINGHLDGTGTCRSCSFLHRAIELAEPS